MEIDSQQMDELLRIQAQQQSARTQHSASTTSAPFEAVFSQALHAQQQTAAPMGGLMPQGAGQAEMISQMLLNPIEPSQQIDATSDLLQSAFDNASGTLDLWDNYAKTLGSASEGSSLRNAYSILEKIDDQVSQLKSQTAELGNQNGGLNALINELEIMTTTERIKFNRGDYA
ncbi:MAG: hypothetical protein K6G15_02575 [Desulfovibrio sp.]|nr:hypothetical protein [Desulfovibrio sp.]